MTTYWTRGDGRFRGGRARGAASRALSADPGHSWRAVLRLPPSAELTAQQIRSAYLETVKRTHPDAGGDVESFIRAKEARDGLLGRIPGA